MTGWNLWKNFAALQMINPHRLKRPLWVRALITNSWVTLCHNTPCKTRGYELLAFICGEFLFGVDTHGYLIHFKVESSHFDEWSQTLRGKTFLQRAEKYSRSNNIFSLGLTRPTEKHCRVYRRMWLGLDITAQPSQIKQLAATQAEHPIAKSCQSLEKYFQVLSPLTSCPDQPPLSGIKGHLHV